MFNRQTRSEPPAFLRVVACFLCLLPFFCWQTSSRADSLEDATRNLAGKVAAAAHGGIVNVEQRNLSSLKALEFSHLQAVFQEELQRHGVKVSPNAGGVKIVFTITGHLTGYLGVAQIQRAEGTITEMEPLGRAADSSPGNPQAAIMLHKEFLFAQDVPLVDVVFSHDRKQAYALGLQEVYAYERRGEQWVLTGTDRLPTRVAPRREMRGFLEIGTETQTAVLPGELCRNSIEDGKGWRCESSREVPPVRSVPPDLISEKKVSSWVSATRFEEDGHTRMIITAKDGLARLYEEGGEPVTTYSEWGSEIASIRSGCGKGWQILVTGKGDWAAADTIQAIEIQEHGAQAASQSVEFGGPVVALHNDSPKNTADILDASEAIAIVHDLEIGRYETYRLTLTCGK